MPQLESAELRLRGTLRTTTLPAAGVLLLIAGGSMLALELGTGVFVCVFMRKFPALLESMAGLRALTVNSGTAPPAPFLRLQPDRHD